MSHFTGAEDPAQLDQSDALARFRAQFHTPPGPDGRPEIYLCGNSLGLQPRRTEAHLQELLSSWRERGVRGHFEGPSPWLPYHEFLANDLAQLVGALPGEVVAMNSLTVNLHLLMASFYRPTPKRHKLLIEAGAFPSDTYAAASQIRFHDYDPREALLLWKPRADGLLHLDDLRQLLAQHGDEIALILLPGVQYYTGQALDLEEITRLGHAAGAQVGIDLAHAAGNLVLELHRWGVDFACWCSYKYLNSGPGAIAGAFVHERHGGRHDLPRLAGWWGHDKSSRFQMGPDFVPISGAEGWQLSNPPIFALAPVRASLEVFRDAGFMRPLREKSERLTGYLEALLLARLGDDIGIVTPREPRARGCQLSLTVTRAPGRALHERLTEAGVACDWREPNVIRVAPTPLYNSFSDVSQFVSLLEKFLARA